MRKLILSTIAASLFAPPAMASGPAENVVERIIERETQRAASLDAYVVHELHMETTDSVQYFEKVVDKDDGYLGFRLVGPAELQRRVTKGLGESSDKLTEAASVIANYAPLVITYFGGLAIAMGDPDVSFDEAPEGESSGIDRAKAAYGELLGGLLGAETTNYREQVAGLKQARRDLREFGRKAEIVDVKEFEGREAYYLIARDVNKTQETSDGKFTIQHVGMIVDAEYYEPLQMRVEGVSKTSEGEHSFIIAQTMLDYDEVDGSSYRIPHRKISLVEFDYMKGKSKKERERQQKEIEKARAEYEKMKEQLAQLPARQREMMEAMMGEQLREMEKKFEAIIDQHAFGNETIVKQARAGNEQTYIEMLLGVAGELEAGEGQ